MFGTKKTRFALTLAAVMAVTAVFMAPVDSDATTVVGPVLVETANAAVAGSCDVGERCVEQCLRMSDGSDAPQGIFCCAPGGSIGAVGVSCGSVGGIAGRFDGPV